MPAYQKAKAELDTMKEQAKLFEEVAKVSLSYDVSVESKPSRSTSKPLSGTDADGGAINGVRLRLGPGQCSSSISNIGICLEY